MNEKYQLPRRISLSNLDTPVESCERLSSLFPGGPQVFIKRDDFIGSLVWGNKLRKLEFVLADAVGKGADTVITCGGVQSNHCRITAQVAKRLGLDCILVQNGEAPKVPAGNHKVNRMLNIEIQYVPSAGDRNARMEEVSTDLISAGKKPYIIPLGASNGIGCLGYIEAMRELRQQQEKKGIEFDVVVHSSSSGGTQAGLELGKRIYGLDRLRIIGISSDTKEEDLKNNILGCTGPAAELLKVSFKIEPENLNVDTGFIGKGYGIATPESIEAEKIFLKNEGIMLDQTYTAKAAAGLIDLIRKGKLTRGQKVLFWHTGGILANI